MDLLCTEGLLEAGVVDAVWGNGWRPPTGEALHKAQHGWPADDRSGVDLQSAAVVACFCVHFPDVLADLGRRQGRYVVITRDGDPPLQGGWPDSVHHIFAINVEHPSPRVTPMPMAFHAFRDNVDQMAAASELPRLRGNRVLVSHSLDMPGSVYVAGHQRITAIERFRHEPWATVNNSLLGWATRTGPVWPSWNWPEYAARLREHDYLAVPVGYGTERIAQWEAIALGTIPICIRHPALSHFADMPIAFVDSWSEVTPEWCDAHIDMLRRPKEKITLSYWVARIREKRAEIGLSS